MNQDENRGCWGVLLQGTDNSAVRDDIGLELAGFNVEDEYQNGNGGEDMRALMRKVVFDETVLSVRHFISSILLRRILFSYSDHAVS